MLPKVSLDQPLKDKTKIKKKNSYFQENLFENDAIEEYILCIIFVTHGSPAFSL